MLKSSMIAATALFAATFLVQPQANAAPAAVLKGHAETASVQLVGGRHHGDRDWRGGHHGRDWRRDRHRRHGWDGHRRLRHHRLGGYGYRDHGQFRWDGRGFVTRAYHPRYGWVWVRVSADSGRPLAHWR